MPEQASFYCVRLLIVRNGYRGGAKQTGSKDVRIGCRISVRRLCLLLDKTRACGGRSHDYAWDVLTSMTSARCTFVLLRRLSRRCQHRQLL